MNKHNLFSSRTILYCLAIIFCMASCKPGADQGQLDRPNILLAISDDQSYIHAGPYGHNIVRTPALDQLAREGIVFSNAFTASPMCTVSRASLLTGRNPWQNGEAGQHWSHFPGALVTYPDLLEQAGYAVGFTGKGWGPGNWKVTGRNRNPAGPAFNELKVTSKPADGIADYDYAGNFRAFLEQKDDNSPFCFWYGASEPHSPYEEGSGIRAGYRTEDLRLTPNYADTSEAVKSGVLDYFLEIEWFDIHLGRMVEILKETGDLENTIILVTSDNGTPMPFAKSNLYDYGTHVPLVVVWPGRTAKGIVLDDLVGQIDLAPTFLELAGLEAFPGMAGRSIVDLITAGKGGLLDPSREFILTAQEKSGHIKHNHLGYPMRAIRTHDYLYIRNFRPERWPGGDIGAEERARLNPRLGKRPEEELYKINEDVACQVNLAAQKDYVDIKNELKIILEENLRIQSDPRILGYGDMYESFPRYGNYRPELDGFKQKGEYNPEYLLEIPDEIFISKLYGQALDQKGEK